MQLTAGARLLGDFDWSISHAIRLSLRLIRHKLSNYYQATGLGESIFNLGHMKNFERQVSGMTDTFTDHSSDGTQHFSMLDSFFLRRNRREQTVTLPAQYVAVFFYGKRFKQAAILGRLQINCQEKTRFPFTSRQMAPRDNCLPVGTSAVGQL
jgi:hypothetical protein